MLVYVDSWIHLMEQRVCTMPTGSRRKGVCVKLAEFTKVAFSATVFKIIYIILPGTGSLKRKSMNSLSGIASPDITKQ